MKMKKSIMTILTATAILLSLLGPTLYKPVTAADSETWFTTMNGVLTSDTYLLYPYEYNSLDFGLSKFGEMIDGTDGLPDVGLQYPGYEVVGTYDQRDGTSRDPFANEEITKNLWLNGWLLEARYTHRTQRDRRVLAMAMFADMSSFGGDWLNGHPLPLESIPWGGRKTTGYAETEDLQVLYDGPREYIALCVTHLYDWFDGNEDGVVDHPDETWPILDIKLTFIFNKVKKQVIILKDIKITISGKELDSPVDVQFSNREEWDLGPAPNWHSYAHFWHQENETCYGPEWHLAPGIMREYIYTHLGPIAGVPIWDNRDPYGPPIVDSSARLYVNGVFKEEGIDYTIDYDTGAITWFIYVAYTDEVKVVYKLWKHEPVNNEWGPDTSSEPYVGVPHLYDVAQIISDDSPNPLYVGWKAFWPTLSDYTVDGWSMSFKPLINVSQPNIIPSEPEIPFVIGEWDFMLGKEYPLQFRGVEVIGLSDWHDADDVNAAAESWSNGVDVMDREAKYQLDEVFDPWDLKRAVHKETKRWVEFTWGTSWTSTYIPVVDVADADWDQYAVFSERVIDLTTDTLLNRWEGDYTFSVDADGYGHITGLLSTHYYKILYSTREEIAAGYTGLIQLGLCLDGSGSLSSSDWSTITSGVAEAIRNNLVHDGTVELTVVQFSDGARVEIQPTLIDSDATAETLATTVEGLTQMAGMTAMADGLYVTWNATKNSTRFDPDLMQVINVATDGVPNKILSYTPPASWGTPPGTAAGDVTFVRNNAVMEGLNELDAEAIGSGPNMNWMRDSLVWPQPGNIAPPYAPGWVEQVADADAFAAAMAEKFERLIPWPRGRYEWVTVGRDAASVDSVGAALVSEAFDSEKDIRIGIGGEDMLDPEIANRIPWVMAKFGTGDTLQDYYYNKEGLYVEDYRTALKDDWCTYWPISSSNMIGVGGPLANMLAYYGNDFTNAFYGMPAYAVESPYSGMITGIPCWNRGWDGIWNVYESSTSVGYAVISTYLDINGTVLFLVWGHWGRDTYYATQWFHGDVARGILPGIVQLQDAPEHLTSIILEINYEDPEHPTFSIPECLGTISETEWIHEGEVKGGIHDP